MKDISIDNLTEDSYAVAYFFKGKHNVIYYDDGYKIDDVNITYSIYPLNCKIDMVNGILTDIKIYNGKDISNLPYFQRYTYLKNIKIDGIKYSIIEIIKISEFYNYVSYYLQNVPYANIIKGFLFFTETEDLGKFMIDDIEVYFKIKYSVNNFKFIAKLNKKGDSIVLYTNKILSQGIRYYAKCRYNEQYLTLLKLKGTLILECYRNFNEWIPQFVCDDSPDKIDLKNKL